MTTEPLVNSLDSRTAADSPRHSDDPRQAAAFFAARLAFQTDVTDVRAGLGGGLGGGFVLIDSRSRAAWDQGHIPGAIHLPTAEIAERAGELLDPAVPVVTYCWGPGCNGATRAALALSLAGYSVKEMIGGVEYWIREGFPLRTPNGDVTAAPDPRTAPVAGSAAPHPHVSLIAMDGEAPACGC
jgi:rhodanese-related sulfurtransferase